MKLKALLIAGAAVAVAVPTVAGAAQGGTTRDAITGGGQAFFANEGGAPSAGAGDTVAFTAKRAKGAPDESTAAEGNIQVNRRTTSQVKFHGSFDCLVVNGEPKSGAGMAWAAGESRNGVPFQLYVEDGGKGQMERNDMIMLLVGEDTQDGDGPCGFDDADTDSIALARGNVQVRNRNLTEDYQEENGQAGQASAPLSLLGL